MCVFLWARYPCTFGGWRTQRRHSVACCRVKKQQKKKKKEKKKKGMKRKKRRKRKMHSEIDKGEGWAPPS